MGKQERAERTRRGHAKGTGPQPQAAAANETGTLHKPEAGRAAVWGMAIWGSPYSIVRYGDGDSRCSIGTLLHPTALMPVNLLNIQVFKHIHACAPCE